MVPFRMLVLVPEQLQLPYTACPSNMSSCAQHRVLAPVQNDVKTEDVKGMPDGTCIKCSDPFLLALVGSNRELGDQAAKDNAALQEEYSEVERLLQSRADRTGEQLRHLLDLISVRAPPGTFVSPLALLQYLCVVTVTACI